jgi:hypothetical protein
VVVVVAAASAAAVVVVAVAAAWKKLADSDTVLAAMGGVKANIALNVVVIQRTPFSSCDVVVGLNTLVLDTQ